MSINTELANLHSFADFRRLIENANPGITFWGWRHVSISFHGHLEKIPIKFLIERVRNLSIEQNFDYTPGERAQGEAVVTKISALYKAGDEVVKRAFFLTRIFCSIREFFKEIKERAVGLITIRERWEVWNIKMFSYYTSSQFQEAYGMSYEQALAQGLNIDVSPGARGPVLYRIVREFEPLIGSAGLL